jgi:NitT/TauT family transport system ATP-binding protein
VVLTGRGKELLLQDINGRKKIIKRQLLRLPTFRLIVDILKAQPERKMPYDTIVDVLVTHLPEEDPGRLARAIIDWGRFGELVGYNSRTGTVYLDQEE